MDRAQGDVEIRDVVAEGEPGKEVVEIPERDDGEERDIDRVVEHQGGARHQPREVTQSAEGEVLAPSRQGIGGRQLGIAEADQREHQASRQEGQRGKAQRGERDDAQSGINVGPDCRIAPHVRAPDGNVPSELAPRHRFRAVSAVGRWLHAGLTLGLAPATPQRTGYGFLYGPRWNPYCWPLRTRYGPTV